MRLLEIQRRYRKLGNLRLGAKGPKGEPRKLDTWRLTSPQQTLIEQAAELWGGTPRVWGDKGWEVITETDSVPVWVPPQRVETWYEKHGKGGRQRKCDGITCLLSKGGALVEVDCMCDPDNRECNPITRFEFFLPDLFDIGIWLLTSSGYNAAAELAGSIEMLAGRAVEANLKIEHRESKRPGQQVHRFNVPVLHVPISARQALAGEPGTLGVVSEPKAALPPQGGTVQVGQNEESPVTPDEEEPDPELMEVKERQIAALKAAAVEVEPSPSSRKVGEDHHGTSGEPAPLSTAIEGFLESAEHGVDSVLADLVLHLEHPPQKSETMDVWEVYCRDLFRMMEEAGEWVKQPHWRYDPLHQALAKRHRHTLTELRKSELLDFTSKARDKAVEHLKEKGLWTST
jgi:hypothetical protein